MATNAANPPSAEGIGAVSGTHPADDGGIVLPATKRPTSIPQTIGRRLPAPNPETWRIAPDKATKPDEARRVDNQAGPLVEPLVARPEDAIAGGPNAVASYRPRWPAVAAVLGGMVGGTLIWLVLIAVAGDGSRTAVSVAIPFALEAQAPPSSEPAALSPSPGIATSEPGAAPPVLAPTAENPAGPMRRAVTANSAARREVRQKSTANRAALASPRSPPAPDAAPISPLTAQPEAPPPRRMSRNPGARDIQP
jgi:hypothetical protein